MEIATACGTSVLSTIVVDLVKSTGRQVGYIFRFKSIIEDLNKEAESLRSAQVDMQSRVDIAIKKTEEIDKKVEDWRRDVTAVVADAEDLEKQTREKKTCLNGLCPNLIWRYQMARRAQKKIGIMSKLKDGGNFGIISHRTTLSGINVLTPKDFMPFESTTDSFNLIIEALKDDKTNVVGLYGMGGVGKTTLAKAVVKKAKEEKIFNEVVMVVVSQTPNIRGIQGQIADLLNLELHHESEVGRAERLYMRLKDEKKILIILDDIWKKIDLAAIGIPVDDRYKDCKIFLTTRQKQVCIDMGCQSRIPLDVLNEKEGLVLFKSHSGLNDDHGLAKEVEISLKVKLAKEVVKECKGLPLAIVAIGSALKEKDIDEWKLATQKLKKSKLMDVGIVDEELYACLKLSYDYLNNEKTKSCFLFCSLFPEDHEIDMEELVRYGPGFGLYQNTNSIEEARSELRVMVNRLKASSLLLDAEEGHVKMHDVVRDVALWITSKGEEVFMVKAGVGLTEWPKQEGMEQCTAISLMGNLIEVLPDGLVCPKLKILLLEGNNVEVSDEFFEGMKTLKVASLNWVHLSLNSLQFLTNLVTLQLFNCEWRDFSSLKKLSKLEILNLNCSSLIELPEELGELNKLRTLDITNCYDLKRIPANVILRLSQLEELYIGGNSFKAWVVEGTNAELSNASLSELYQLNHLTILSLNINVQPCLSKDFVLPTKLLRYDIGVNDYIEESYPKSRLLKIRGIEATSLVAFKALYENVEYLELGDIKGCCQNMVPSIDETGLNELKRLSLTDFDELECIIDTTQQQDVASTAFSNLVDLSLHSVGLREICSGGRPPRGFLENLETLHISGCYSMSNSLFPSWMLIQSQRRLKEVYIEYCRELEDVFQLEGLSYAKENPFLLSSLESLHLSWLNNLRYIWKGPTQQVSLQSLTVVEVESCNKLRYLFTLSLARSLLQLEQLTVKNCGSLEHIVEIKEAEENVGGGGGNDVMFPKLRKLLLDRLENFINFYSENSSLNLRTAKEQLQNLEELKISECRRVQVLFQLEGIEQELSLPSLKVLELEYLEELECLCKGPTHLLILPNLKKLEVWHCKRLRHMFSPSLARNLLQLEELNIEGCGELEYIVSIKAEENVGGGGGNDVMLPKLRILKLDGVENFISFFDSENLSLNMQTTKKQLRGLRHGLPNLEELYIHRCRVQVLFHLEGLEQKLAFPSLKVLDLYNLKELECLCKGPTHLLSLPNLKKLEVRGCNRLRHMFSPSLARNLLQLEELIISVCGELEYIVSIKAEENVGGGGGNDVMLPKLRILQLVVVENFISFFDSENLSPNVQTTKKQLRGLRHGLQNLEELIIWNCRVQVLFHLEGLEQELAFPSLKVLGLYNLEELECLCKGPTHLLSLPNLKKLEVQGCKRLRHMFSPSLARNLLQMEELIIWDCRELEYIVSIKAEENVGGGGGNDVMLPKLRILNLDRLENFIDFFDSENLSLNVQTTKKQLRGLRHGFQNLEELEISRCRVQVLFHLEGLEQELAFPSLKVLKLKYLEELEWLCKGPMHLLSLPNLKKLEVWGCNRPRHMFSPSIARNFMQLEEMIIRDCWEIEQIFIEDDAAEYHPTLLKDHLQWPLLFPNLSSIFIRGCNKLKTLFPAVTTARSGLQKLKTLIVEKSSQLEELFGHKDEADMTSEDREMVLPQLQILTLQELASLVNFCPIGYHFKFPSLSELVVSRCPKITTRFSVDQNRSVYAEAEAPQTGKEEVDMEQSPPKTTREIYCWNPDDLRKRLPPYIGK